MTYEAPAPANAPTNTTVTGEYGGNISQMTWQTRGREKQSYTFKYDYINRMTEADYADISNAGAITNDRYTEKLTYDIRGNIQTLQRNGYNSTSCAWGQIDNLTYQYDPYNQGYNPYNKVYKITDYSDASKGFVTQSNGSAYSYDVDGNMTADPNKGITGITYNHLNLPTVITFTSNRTITFLYDASGNKLRKTVNNNGTVLYTQDYVNGIEYKNGNLEAIYHSEGRVTYIDGILKYEYAMKDHLGNTRLMFCDRNGDGVIKPENAPEPSEVTQENSYYAFGMNMEFGAWENTPSVTDNLHQYNGKEWNTDFGLNWNDYGARFYDAATARWNVMDPMAEKYMAYNPYNYGFNNPIGNIDPSGMDPIPLNTSTGGTTYQGYADVGGLGTTEGTQTTTVIEQKNGVSRVIAQTTLRGVSIFLGGDPLKDDSGNIILAYIRDKSDNDQKTHTVYGVPLYEMTVSGTNDKGVQVTQSYAVVRVGVEDGVAAYFKPSGDIRIKEWSKDKGGEIVLDILTGNNSYRYAIHVGRNDATDVGYTPTMANQGCPSLCVIMNQINLPISQRSGAMADFRGDPSILKAKSVGGILSILSGSNNPSEVIKQIQFYAQPLTYIPQPVKTIR